MGFVANFIFLPVVQKFRKSVKVGTFLRHSVYINDNVVLWLHLESLLSYLLMTLIYFYAVFTDKILVIYLQSCLTAIFDWSEHWQMELSPSIYVSVMHIKANTQCPINNQTVYPGTIFASCWLYY